MLPCCQPKGPCSSPGDLEEDQGQNYVALVAALERRFGSEEQSELHRVQLRSRLRNKGESLPELAQAISRLTREAYPSADWVMRDMLAMENFVDCLDTDLRLKVVQTRPRSMDQAVKIATELEAYKVAEKQRERGKYARMTIADEEAKGAKPKKSPQSKDPDVNTIADEVAKILDARKPSPPPSGRTNNAYKPRTKANIACYNCGGDHYIRDCPQEVRCLRCGREGHLSRSCRQSSVQCTTCRDSPQGNGSLLGPRPMAQQ